MSQVIDEIKIWFSGAESCVICCEWTGGFFALTGINDKYRIFGLPLAKVQKVEGRVMGMKSSLNGNRCSGERGEGMTS